MHFKKMNASLIFALFLLTTTTELSPMEKKNATKEFGTQHAPKTINRGTQYKPPAPKGWRKLYNRASLTYSFVNDNPFLSAVVSALVVTPLIFLAKEKIRERWPNHFENIQSFLISLEQAYNKGDERAQLYYAKKYHDSMSKITSLTPEQDNTLWEHRSRLEKLGEDKLSSFVKKRSGKINGYDELPKLFGDDDLFQNGVDDKNNDSKTASLKEKMQQAAT